MNNNIITKGFVLRRLDREQKDSLHPTRAYRNVLCDQKQDKESQNLKRENFSSKWYFFVAMLLLSSLILLLSCSDPVVQIIEVPPVLIPLPDTVTVYDMQFLDTLNGWIATSLPQRKYKSGRGGIYKTSDGGITWYQSCLSESTPLYSLSFVDHKYGWTCGKRGVILNTTNGGKSWTKYSTRELLNDQDTLFSFMSVHFLNRTEGWVGGFKYSNQPDCSGLGYVFHTTDGGKNWQISYSGGVGNVRNIHFPQSGNGWAVGGGHFSDCDPFIIHTTDNGATWIQKYFPTYLQYAMTVSFHDDKYGFIGGGLGIIRTTNGGDRWDTIGIPIAPVGDISTINDSVVFAMGSTVIYQSTNKGKQWSKQFEFPGFSDVMSFLNDTTGWVAGANSNYYGFTVYRYRNNSWIKIR